MNWGLQNGTKVHKVEGRKNLTVMLISDPTKNGITLRIPKWIRFPLMILPVLLLLGTLYTYSYIAELENQLALERSNVMSERYSNVTKDNTITELEVTDAKRYSQLERLAELTVQLKARLSELEAYKAVIDEKLGTADRTVTTEPTRRAVGNGESLSLKDVEPVINNLTLTGSYAKSEIFEELLGDQDAFAAEIDRLMAEVTSTIEVIEEEKTAFATADEKVDEMLPYWNAYPSAYPVEKPKITSPYGYRRNPFGSGYEFHKGVDFKARYVDVMTTGAGVVTYSGYYSGYGYMVIIDHGYGILTKYAHNSKLYVKKGDKVERYDVIARSGNSGRSSGPHLHYEIIQNGERKDPMSFIGNE